jgi:hypothetical protein
VTTQPAAAPPPTFEEASEAYAQSLVRTAKWYTELGCQVLPLAIGRKSPAGGEGWNIPGNQLIATDHAGVESIWLARYRGCGVGMYCSFESRTLILDIDVKHGATGPKSLMEHQARFGALPPTMKNNSPSGGYHLVYFVPPEWLPARNRSARFAVSGMEILFNRRQAVMAPTRLADGGTYNPEIIDPVRRLPMPIATLTPEEVDAIVYGRQLESDEERTKDWSQAHHGSFDGDNEERNKLADGLIDALSMYPSDSFGRAAVEADCQKMRECGPGMRYPRLKELAMHLVLIQVNDGAVIKLDDAMNELMDAYKEAQLATGEWSALEASNALDTMRWAVTRPSVIASIQALDGMRGWAGALTMPAEVAAEAKRVVAGSYRSKFDS